jgi:glycosyltransferase involved in cell wall biosynthesis
MKVLRVIASMDPATGGPCQGIRYSIAEMQKLGVHTEVVCLDPPGLTSDPFPVHALGPGKGKWVYNKALRTWLDEHLSAFDAVIIHGLWLYPGYAVYKAMGRLRDRGPKWFLMPHGMLDPYFQQAAGRRLKAFTQRLYWNLIESRIAAGVNGILFTTAEEMRLAATTFRKYTPRKVVDVGYGIPGPPEYRPSMLTAFSGRAGLPGDRAYMLYLSRIHPKKGTAELLDAYEGLLSTGLDLPLLVIAGPGMEEPYGVDLRERVRTTPLLSERVFFPGMLSGDQKWGAFYGAEVFVLPSHQENFGIAIVEALACGKAVLISDKVNIYREITACKGGIVGEDSAAATQAVLAEWTALPEPEKVRMHQNAFCCFQDHFSISQAAKKMLRVLQ